MAVTDLLADAFTKIRNAFRARKEKVDIKASNVLKKIVEILKNEGFINDFRFIEDNRQGIIRIYLKYYGKKSAIRDIKRISKPGRRVYVNKTEIPKVLGGIGIAILTTSQGILTDSEARKIKVGGEVICYIY
jgi:small subunit ribosomal protein S8